MSLLHWVQVVAIGAPTVTNFSGESGLVQNGAITGKGKAAIIREAKKLPADAQLTIVACVENGVGVRDASMLGEGMVAELKKAMPKLAASYVVRNVPAANCPAGVMLESAGLPVTTVPQAQVVSATGKVEAQLPDGRTIPIYQGSVVVPQAIIITQAGARCAVTLPEGSTVRIGESSRFSLEAFQKAGAPQKQVKLKLWIGKAWAKVQSLGGTSKWDLESGNAVAGVRGTSFQMSASDPSATASTQVAVHEGAVVLEAGGPKSVAVPEGYGAAAKGKEVGDPRPLPASPTGLTPEFGSFVKETIASWGSVPGAVAYRVEIAADPQFTDVRVSAQFKATKAILESPAGTWYWRVIAIDGEGYESAPSQLFKIKFEKRS